MNTAQKISKSLLEYNQQKDPTKPKVDVPWGKTKEQHNKYYARWRELNRDDYNKNRKAWADKNRAKRTMQARKSVLKNRYNLSHEQYDEMLKKQNYVCAICQKPPKTKIDKLGRVNQNLFVDHNHTTGAVRGLLCHHCNTAVGHFNEDVKIMINAIKYIDDKAINVEDFIKHLTSEVPVY